MRVLRVITRLNIGGPSIQAIRLWSSLSAEGFDTLLLHGCVGDAEGDMSYLMDDASVPRRPKQIAALKRPIAPWSDARALLALFRAIAAFRPQIVHTHMAKAGLLARTAAILHNWTRPASDRIRIVHTYHGHVLDGYFSGPTTSVFIGLERLLSHATDRLIAVSSLVRDDLLQRYRIGSPERFTVVPLGLDLDPFAAIDQEARAAAKRALDIPAESHVVTTVGRLTAIKNHRLFLDMAERLVATGRPVRFLIAGDGELRLDLERDAAARGIGDAVRFLGWRRDLTTIYGASDVFAITSANEGTPVALIEAMAAGVPGVATDVGGVRDVILDGSTGIVVPPGDAEAITLAVDTLIADADRRATIGAAARQSVLSRFAFERLSADIAKLYRELLGQRT